jgi:putative hydrolase of the HAD superfamily
MEQIKALGFDLFNTLITVDHRALDLAVSRLIESLNRNGLRFDGDQFKIAHRSAAIEAFEKAAVDGKETHNRFWISAALSNGGHHIPPDDPRIEEAVEEYFSAFLDLCHRIPGTKRMLERVCHRYRLGLLSNFTHAPAALKIIDQVELGPFFDVVVISGAIGYRKPHPRVFKQFVEKLGVANTQILFVGDDIVPDIEGATRAGIKPVWTTYVRDRRIPPAPGMESGPIPQGPDGDVPRISSWDELLTLLGKDTLKPDISS